MTTSPPVSTDPLVPTPLDIATVAVALDGSPHAERALDVAQWAARNLDARVELIEVVTDATDAPAARSYLHDLAPTAEVYVRADVADGLATAFGLGDRVLPVMATHGRATATAAAGSVIADVLAVIDRPVLIVGPSATAPAADAPVVVTVEGSAADDDLVEAALGWARALDRRLVAATVVEPAPPTFDADHPAERSIGPVDVTGYHRALLERCAGSGVAVETAVVDDPISVVDGLAAWLPSVGPALVVTGARRRRGLARFVHGERAVQLARVVSGPVLVVELGLRR
jgi:nucleotide-binding universal stress UspA family protein